VPALAGVPPPVGSPGIPPPVGRGDILGPTLAHGLAVPCPGRYCGCPGLGTPCQGLFPGAPGAFPGSDPVGRCMGPP
jgi:hypothetical protein